MIVRVKNNYTQDPITRVLVNQIQPPGADIYIRC